MTEPPIVVPASRRALSGLRLAIIDDRDGPLPAMLVALTVLAGVVDASSILGLGHVFVATITGNLVFVGLAVAGAQGFSVVPCLLAIGGFIVGALAGGHACRVARGHRGRALRNVLGAKLALATVVTAIIVSVDGHPGARTQDIAIVLLAMSMGCQLAAIRYLKVPDLLTVVLTLTITGALTERGLGPFHPAVLRRAIAVLAFAVGAILGGLLVVDVSLSAALGLGLAIIVSVAIAAHLASRSSAGWATPR
jgi:uncharacterized membrane protein YoaK (UPF0700 family)